MEQINQQNNDEQIRHALVEKMFNLIKQSPDIKFVVYGIGNVLGKKGADTGGGRGYSFDYKTQKMVMDHAHDFLDDTSSKDEDFIAKWSIRKFQEYKYIVVKLPIKAGYGDLNNPYLTDIRGGVNFTLAIRYTENKLGSLGPKEIEEKLKNPNIGFFGDLLEKCAKEFIPDYYNYVRDLQNKYEERNKK